MVFFNLKRSFTLLELLFIIIIVSIVITISLPKLEQSNNKLQLATSRIILYLQHTRYLATIENQYDPKNSKWFKKLWTMKFQRCRDSIGGLYFVVHSDKDTDGYIDKIETALDPLTKRHLYSSNSCNEHSELNNKYVLLTNEYDIVDVEITPNKTDSLGRISFDQYGRIYSKLSGGEYTNEIKDYCIITLTHKSGEKSSIKIHQKTGYIEQI